jgi:hypothetical protein
MLDAQGMIEEKTIVPRIYKYLVAVLVLGAIMLVAHTALNTYFGSQELAFPYLTVEGSTGPNDIGPLDCLSKMWGGHYFGDFQSEYCRMRQVTPYPIDRPSSYLPGFYVVSGFIALLPSSVTAFRVVVLLAFAFGVYVMRSHFERKDLVKLSPLVLLTFYPFWFAIDRGNYGWIFGPLLVLLATTRTARSQRYWLLAVAFSLKHPLAIFGLIFFLDGTWRTKCKELLKFGGIFVFLNFIFPLLQWPNAERWPALVLRIQGFSSGETQVGMRSNDFDIRSRSDLQALRTAFHRFRFLGDVQFRMLLLICAAFVAVILLKTVFSVQKRKYGNFGIIEISLASACLGVLLSPFSFTYGLMTLLIPLVLLVSSQGDSVRFGGGYLALITVCTAPNAIPLTALCNVLFKPEDGVLDPDFPTLGTIMIPLLLITILLLVLYSAVLSYLSTRATQDIPVVVSADQLL